MSKVKIYIKTNDYGDTQDICSLLNLASGLIYNISAVSPDDNMKKSSDRLRYDEVFFKNCSFYFEFVNPTTIPKVDDYDKLVQFAREFKNIVINIIKDSKHKDRLKETDELQVSKALTLINEAKYRDILVRNELSNAQYFSFDKLATSNFFHPNPQFSNRFKAELAGGIILGLIALPLFFFEPFTATLCALCAIVLLCSAYSQYQQDNKANMALGT